MGMAKGHERLLAKELERRGGVSEIAKQLRVSKAVLACGVEI
jgi:hypothetical protein